MSFTKVAPAGIGTSPGTSILIGDSLLHSTGIDIGSNTGVGVTIRQHGDATFTGIVTAASFSGSGANLTGIDATSIKHTDGNVKVQAINTGANLTGNLSVSGNLGVGGVLTYEDVTNVDSVGVITARSGIKIGPTAGVAATIFADGSINSTGIVTARQGVRVPHGSDSTNYISVGNNGALRFWATGHSYADIRAGNLHFRNNSLQNILEIQQDKDIFVYGPSFFLDATRFDQTVTIADTITHHGDTDTKIRFPAVDTFTVETAGSERLRIDSNGKLIATQSASNIGLELHATGSGRGSQTKYHNDHGEAYVGQAGDTTGNLLIHNTSNTNMLFATNNAERLRIDNGGIIWQNYGRSTQDARFRFDKQDAGSCGTEYYMGGSQKAYIHLDSEENMVYLGQSGVGHNFYTGGSSKSLAITSGGVVETYGGGGAAGLRIKNGGDLEIYASNNSSKAILYCDNNEELYVHKKIRFYDTSGGILRSNGQYALKPTGACIQTKVTYRGSKFTNSSGSYQVVHSHDFNGIESGNIIGMHLDCDMNADTGGSSWQMMGLRIGSTMYSEKIIEHNGGMNMNASANGLTGAMSAGNHAVQFVTRNGGGTCSYNEGNNATGIVLHTYEYVS